MLTKNDIDCAIQTLDDDVYADLYMMKECIEDAMEKIEDAQDSMEEIIEAGDPEEAEQSTDHARKQLNEAIEMLRGLPFGLGSGNAVHNWTTTLECEIKNLPDSFA